MSEFIIKEQLEKQLEIERKRDDLSRLERIHGVEREYAVLRGKLDDTIKWFDAAIERAVSGEDLKELKREMEDQLKQTTNAIYEHFKSANDQQVREILGHVELMNAKSNEVSSRDAKNLRTQIFLMMLGTVFSVIGSIVFLVVMGRG